MLIKYKYQYFLKSCIFWEKALGLTGEKKERFKKNSALLYQKHNQKREEYSNLCNECVRLSSVAHCAEYSERATFTAVGNAQMGIAWPSPDSPSAMFARFHGKDMVKGWELKKEKAKEELVIAEENLEEFLKKHCFSKKEEKDFMSKYWENLK